MKLGSIVEGHGEVGAVRLLVEVVARHLELGTDIQVLPPLRVKRQRVVQQGELERHVELLGNRVGPTAAILVLLDADRDCAASLGPELLARALAARPAGAHGAP